jgi:thiol:disulfide interchange protein DsbD
MKVFRIILILCISWIGAQAQFIEPVKWKFDADLLEDGSYQLNFHAAIDDGWHLYSHYIEDGGPIPTTFYIEESTEYTTEGDLREFGEREAKFDEIFKMDLAWFSEAVTFSQRVQLADGVESTVVKGELEFMVCNDRECLPPEYIPFSFDLTGAGGGEEITDEATTGMNLEVSSEVSTSISGEAGFRETEPFKIPVNWSYRLYADEGSETSLTLEWKAELDEGWHIYSIFIDEGGPIPTTFYLEGNDNVSLIGDILESGEKITKQDDVFNMLLSWYGEEVVYIQKLEWTSREITTFNGSVEFMVCDDEQCLPPEDLPFEIDLGPINQDGQWVPFGLADEPPPRGDCDEGVPLIMCQNEFDDEFSQNDCTGHESHDEKKSYLLIFLLGFGGGFIALLTPCVFPMIPLTVSFFTKGGEKANARGVRNAVIYGISIIIIYVSLGLFVTLVFGPEMLNWIATDPIFNVFFFLIFVFFAISFFGYFDLTLPNSWTNRTDRIASKGGLIGIFFMAFTLALVSFSCTGPIIGSLIVEAVRQGVMGPFFGMLGFAIALALPFTLFAIFPKWMNSLPQSGGWLETVKKFLGFLELAFALKFLSTADLTRHWGILKYELFVGLWILIFLAMGLYLVGILKFRKEGVVKIGWIRRSIGLASLAFTAYMVIGVINQKPLLSGIAPPPGYSLFNPTDCPIGVNVCFKDYEEGMAYARQTNQPVMLDFTGHGCVNCRLMENNVWTDEEVNRLLNEYVIISLYVDDRKDLPEEKHYTSIATGRTKEIKKVGKYWHDFQFRHFGTLSQPYYVLVGPNKEVLNKPIAFSNKEDYKKFLECGLTNLEGICPECFSPVATRGN